jgi:hypothetical protein
MMNPARSMWGWDGTKPRPIPNRTNPAVRRAAIKALPVPTTEDRALVAFTDSQVDRSGRTRHPRNEGGLVALPDDVKSPMATLEAEILDIGGARLGDPKAVQSEQDGQRGIVAIEPLSGEQKCAQLVAVHAVAFAR